MSDDRLRRPSRRPGVRVGGMFCLGYKRMSGWINKDRPRREHGGGACSGVGLHNKVGEGTGRSVVGEGRAIVLALYTAARSSLSPPSARLPRPLPRGSPTRPTPRDLRRLTALTLPPPPPPICLFIPRTKPPSRKSRHQPRPHPAARIPSSPILLLLRRRQHISCEDRFRGPVSADLRFRRARPNASAALSPNRSFVCELARHGSARAHVLDVPPVPNFTPRTRLSLAPPRGSDPDSLAGDAPSVHPASPRWHTEVMHVHTLDGHPQASDLCLSVSPRLSARRRSSW